MNNNNNNVTSGFIVSYFMDYLLKISLSKYY